MTEPLPGFSCSADLGKIILRGLKEVMGPMEMTDVIHTARLPWADTSSLAGRIPYAQIGALQRSLVERYGERGGSGVALRSGRASCKYGLRQFAPQLGIMDLSFRLLPPRTRLELGVQKLAQTLNTLGDYTITVTQSGDALLWSVERCPICYGHKSDTPICHHTVGFLQEFTGYLCSGKAVAVTETACSASGAQACQFTIDRQPSE